MKKNEKYIWLLIFVKTFNIINVKWEKCLRLTSITGRHLKHVLLEQSLYIMTSNCGSMKNICKVIWPFTHEIKIILNILKISLFIFSTSTLNYVENDEGMIICGNSPVRNVKPKTETDWLRFASPFWCLKFILK